MQVQRISYRVKGFVRLNDYALRWAYMITEKAKHKARVLAFWNKHGIIAAEEAFRIKKRTLYLWKSQLKIGKGKLGSLNEKSKRPKNIRKRNWSPLIKEEIRRLRKEHPNLGKEKIHFFLEDFSKKRIFYAHQFLLLEILSEIWGD